MIEKELEKLTERYISTIGDMILSSKFTTEQKDELNSLLEALGSDTIDYTVPLVELTELEQAQAYIIILESQINNSANGTVEDGITQADVDAVQVELDSVNADVADLEAQLSEALANQEDGITQVDVDAAYVDGAASVTSEENEPTEEETTPTEGENEPTEVGMLQSGHQFTFLSSTTFTNVNGGHYGEHVGWSSVGNYNHNTSFINLKSGRTIWHPLEGLTDGLTLSITDIDLHDSYGDLWCDTGVDTPSIRIIAGYSVSDVYELTTNINSDKIRLYSEEGAGNIYVYANVSPISVTVS